MRRRPRLSLEAITDLDRIRDHVAASSGSAAANLLVNRIEATLKKTVFRFESCGRPRPELGAHVRSYAYPPYVVFYEITGSGVRVLRILHGHRDIKEALMSLLIA